MEITIATQRESNQFKRRVAWKRSQHTGSRRVLDACRVVGAESRGFFGSGTEFSSEDEETVYGTLPWECLLLFEAPVLVAALIFGKGLFYLLLFLSFCSSSLSCSPKTQIWSKDLCGDHLIALPISFHSFLISPLPSSHRHPQPSIAFSVAPHIIFLSPLYLLHSTLPTHDRLCN